jgi:hypothetical protein
VACMGDNCQVTFDDCTFDRCSLLAVDGAEVTLCSPQFRDMDEAIQRISVCVHGAGSTVRVQGGGNIEGGVQGIAVLAGARLEASALNIRGVSHAGVEVIDAGSDVSMHGCIISSSGYAGVCIHGWATGCLDRCTLSGVKSQHGGLQVSGPGSHADARHCHFVRNHHSGVYAVDHASVKLVGCKSVGNGMASKHPHAGGFSVTDGGVMELADCRSEGDSVGCMASQHGHLFAESVDVTGSKHCGFLVQEGGQAMLRECTSGECGESGMRVIHEGSQLDAEACTMRKNWEYGVCARGDVRVRMNGCHSLRNRREGFRSCGNAQMTVTGSSSEEDGGSGAGITDGGYLDIEEVPVNDVFKAVALPEPESVPVRSHSSIRQSFQCVR